MTSVLRLTRTLSLYDARLGTQLRSSSRFLTTSCEKETNNGASKKKGKISTKSVRQNVEGYVFTRYIDMVKNYDKVLEKNFPSAVKVYRVFFDGVKEFYADLKRYLKIWRITNNSFDGLRALNRKELELYMQMPRDMMKVAPALIGTSLPMVGYAILPLVLMYPRTFLTSHFWSLQQKSDFQQLHIRERLHFNRPVFRCLQGKLKSITDTNECMDLNHILGLVGSGFHPAADTLINAKEIFTKPPYNLASLSAKHIKLLYQMHGLPGRVVRRRRLREHGMLIHHMDFAIRREGGEHNMPTEAIRYSCYIRGLNPANLTNDEQIQWLRDWVTISLSLSKEHISLLLHLPLFLAYNHPNNWHLIYKERDPKSSLPPMSLPPPAAIPQLTQLTETPKIINTGCQIKNKRQSRRM